MELIRLWGIVFGRAIGAHPLRGAGEAERPPPSACLGDQAGEVGADVVGGQEPELAGEVGDLGGVEVVVDLDEVAVARKAAETLGLGGAQLEGS